MKRFKYIWGLALAVLLMGGSLGLADQKKDIAFGALEPLSGAEAKVKAEAWLKEVGKTDPATLAKFQAIWKLEERTILDRLADTFTLGNEQAAQLLANSRDPLKPAPTKIHDLFKDAQLSLFFRTNLALAYARNLSNRRVHEEALAVLKLFRPEQAADPAVYLFHRAVAEHALLQKAEAVRSINRLLEDIATSPERYKTVSALMLLDMQTWKDKDLGAVARMMNNVERRLELSRGGPETQKKQKEIVARLDELIKEMENKAKKKPGSGGS